MTALSISLFSCGVINLALLTYVSWRRHTKPVHFAFSALVLSIACWNFSNGAIVIARAPLMVMVIGRAAYVLGVCVCTTYLIFTCLFPDTEGPRCSRRFLKAVGVVGTMMAVLACTRWVQKGIVWSPSGKRPQLGALFPLLVIYMLVTFLWGTVNIARSRLRVQNRRQRMQLNYVLTGFFAAFFLIFMGHFVLARIAYFSEYWMLTGSIGSVWCVAMTGYAVFRYRLMDIGIALRTSAILGIMTLILSVVIYIFLEFYPPLLSCLPHLLHPALALAFAFALAILVGPLHDSVTSFVDQHMFRGQYDHQGALMRLGSRLNQTTGRERIAELAAEELPIILQAEGASVYLWEPETGHFLLAAHSKRTAPSVPVRLPPEHPVTQLLMNARQTILRDELGHDPEIPEYLALAARASLTEMNVALADLLTPQEDPLGLVLLGDKIRDDIFTNDDLRLLGTLASQVAIALENARLVEQALEAEQYYRIILRHIQRGVLTVDNNLRIVTLNDTGADILGVKSEDWIGEQTDKLAPSLAELLRQTLENHRNEPPREVTVLLNGKEFPCECETSLLLDARNKPAGSLILFVDLTERKRFEAEMRRIDRLASVGTLAAGLAHEIKNPLVSIQTFAQLLPERFQDDEFRENFSAVVGDEVKRINRLIQSLLDFARPIPRETGEIDLHDLLDKTLALLDGQFRKENITLQRDYAPVGLPTIIGDREQLHQVLLNLLQNAVLSMDGDQRRITVTTALRNHPRDMYQPKQVIILRISDTGSGVEKDVLPRIFDPFYSTRSDGCGLGLAICHSILTEHGATIEVASTTGKGSTFTVTFPVPEPEERAFILAKKGSP